MDSQIGAGARIYMGDAAAPNSTANGGAASDADLDDVTEHFGAANIQSAMGSVDTTKLDADTDDYWRSFIAGLRSGTAGGNYGDDAAGTFEIRIDGIQAGNNHARGRGKVDMKIRPAGVGAGKIERIFTVIPTSLDNTVEVESEIGGGVQFQIDGPIIRQLQA